MKKTSARLAFNIVRLLLLVFLLVRNVFQVIMSLGTLATIVIRQLPIGLVCKRMHAENAARSIPFAIIGESALENAAVANTI